MHQLIVPEHVTNAATVLLCADCPSKRLNLLQQVA
jgi:hypothetical protein